jgi:PHD/YefM family antitoxin component YafN of YafNO toxin-antitoxin module
MWLEAYMRMVPIKDLKDAAMISRLCHETGEPVHVTKNVCADMVITSAEAYEDMESQTGVGRTVDLVREGIDAVSRGECRDALEAVA